MARLLRSNLKYLYAAVALLFSATAHAQHYPPQDTARARFLRPFHQPQMPVPPYHYTVEDVKYTDTSTGITYGATLTRPKDVKQFPTVVLISGTSAQDRDYTCGNHKYFWVLADYLSNHGIAVLRIDDRSTGLTNGNYFAATTLDFAKDILAGVNFLRTRKDIDTARIGLIGHSEGGIIAPITHNLAPGSTKFMVLISGPVVGLRYINRFQSEQQFRKQWNNDTIVAARMRMHHLVVDNIPDKAPDYPTLQKLLAWAADSFYRSEPRDISEKLRITPDEKGVEGLNRSYKAFMKPWWLWVLPYDPLTDVRKLQCPVLGIYGTKDMQVPPVEDYNLLKANLPANKFSDVVMIKDMNHFMQPDSTTGSWENYDKIDTTIMPAVLDKVTTWIHALTFVDR